ncbi:MAG: CoA pyrophosphatase [Anaeromicrobium sp.]|jgi:8-oxo-dGTP pyrophosphatase MutT (NUDIX family)|uniref:NUDIX hydrolase n=1 Tax=Anaeromicrobium sp. TaxID=1929132 RepID=UPI0025CEB5B6|nr:CoA pyrophosphatase [Anaeromicrobium sp.]MCT4595491.1 CoA pyrophosphatase [Anaeromicrobium sp.]
MDLNEIINRVENSPPKIEGIHREFSVLIPLIEVDNRLHVLFEVRSSNLKVQPNEICFPGGKVEKNESYKECALRETREELNIPMDSIDLIGKLDTLVLPYNLTIYPFCGKINENIEHISYSKDEVSSIFSVPLKFFLDKNPDTYNTHIKVYTDEQFPHHLISGGRDYNWRVGTYPVYFYKYNEHIIWGITAKIIKNFIDIIK